MLSNKISACYLPEYFLERNEQQEDQPVSFRISEVKKVPSQGDIYIRLSLMLISPSIASLELLVSLTQKYILISLEGISNYLFFINF